MAIAREVAAVTRLGIEVNYSASFLYLYVSVSFILDFLLHPHVV